jgi:hypothetical protein
VEPSSQKVLCKRLPNPFLRETSFAGRYLRQAAVVLVSLMKTAVYTLESSKLHIADLTA